MVPDPPDDNEVYPLYAALAFEAMVTDDTEAAGHWLRKIPRAVRGKIKIACDDLDMMLSRMGNTHE